MSETNNATYSGIFSKGYLSALKNTPIDNDKIKIATDSHQMFIDTDNERFEITDFVKDHTEEEIRGILAPLPKLYLASDTGRILIHDGEEWIVIAEKNADVVAKALEADHATNADTSTYASNSSVAETATRATKATNADTATYAQSAGTAANASEATHATSADTATKANSADSATKATNADTATYAKNAGLATSATSADSATNDSAGQKIDSTYVKNVTANGRAITVTKGDGSTFSFNTQDNNTTYGNFKGATSAANGSAGLVPAPVAGKENQFLRADGSWVDVDNVENASSASYATAAGKANEADHATSADSATKAVTADSATKATSADSATKATNADTATYAKNAGTASYATKTASADSATKATNADTATYATSAGTAASATNSSTAEYAKNTALAAKATTADTAVKATTADTAVKATTATNADTANEATHATSADSATKATNADTATYAKNAGLATSATSATKATSADNATKATQDANGKVINSTYAPLASPALTGTPTAPTAAEGTSGKQVANTEFVAKAIANAVAGITDFETSIVESLPATGVKGTIYFVLNGSSETDNIYDEYIWVNGKFEKIGSTKIDLTGYLNDVTTSGTGNAVTGYSVENGKLTLKKDSNFLTAHPSITSSSTTGTESPAAGKTFEVVDSVVTDKNGHVTAFRKKTVTMPNSVASASSAGSATKATQDSAGQQINTTYIKSVVVNGKVLTFTKGDGSTFQLSTQDSNTTYAAMKGAGASAAGGAGLVPAPAAGAQGQFLRGDGTWAQPSKATNADTATYATSAGSASSAGSATKATQDSAGQQINTTYLKNLAISGRTITATKGDGSTFQLTTQDNNTTYGNMKGATSAAAGSAGLVPAPAKGAQAQFLRGDGTWAQPSKATNADTATYATSAGSATKATQDSAGQQINTTYLKNLAISGKTITVTKGDGSTFALTTQDNNTTYANMKAATSATAGSAGLVPAPAKGAQSLFLRGDGTWAQPSNASTATYATSAGSATKATQDSAGQQINTTYLKNITISGKTITVTKGNGSTFTLTTQDNNTTYANMKGATSAAAGSAGLVPAPAKGAQAQFLRGDGTWAAPTAGGVSDGADFDFGDLDG